ncbi:MAG: hypothetical protein AABW49_01495 [Nanoarchaeota archaeon]
MEKPRKDALEEIIGITSNDPSTKLKRIETLIGCFAYGAANIISAVNFLPSAVVHKINDTRINQPLLDDRDIIALELGTLGGITVVLVEIGLYSTIIGGGYPEILLIPVFTNLASAFYEAGRAIYTCNR